MRIKYYLAFLLFVLSACAKQVTLPTDHYYRLPELAGVAEGQKFFHLISVINFQADGLRRERAIVYTKDGIEFNQYHYHNWVDTPSRLLTERLAERLRLSNFAAIVQTTYRGESELIIKGQIKSFERILDEKNDKVRVKIMLQVNSQDRNLPVLFEEYSELVDADSHAISDSIIAFGKAVDLIFERFQKDLIDKLQ